MSNKVLETKLFSEEECNHILSFINDKQFTKSAVQANPNILKEEDGFRKSTEVILEGHLFDFMLPKLKKYGVKTFPEYISIIKYEEGCFFKKHFDADKNDNRYKSLVLQLSNKDDYEGGEMIYYDKDIPITFNKEIGSVVIFNSDVLHEVKPILKGTRYSFVCWFYQENYEIVNSLF